MYCKYNIDLTRNSREFITRLQFLESIDDSSHFCRTYIDHKLHCNNANLLFIIKRYDACYSEIWNDYFHVLDRFGELCWHDIQDTSTYHIAMHISMKHMRKWRNFVNTGHTAYTNIYYIQTSFILDIRLCS